MARKANSPVRNLVEQAELRLQHPIDVDDAMQKLGATGTTSLAKRLAAGAQTHPQRAQAIGQLGSHLLAMAPGRPKQLQRAVLLYVPDGAYQMQVFAIEDALDGSLVVCCEDVLEAAIEGHVVAPAEGTQYRIGDTRLTLAIEQFDGKTENPPAYLNAMTGWNRKAMRITLPPTFVPQHVSAALLLCALSAEKWNRAPVKS